MPLFRLLFRGELDECRLAFLSEQWGPAFRRVTPGTPDQPTEVRISLSSGHWLEGSVVDQEGFRCGRSCLRVGDVCAQGGVIRYPFDQD